MLHTLTRLVATAVATSALAAGAVMATGAPAAAETSSEPAVGVQVHAMWSDYTDAQRVEVFDKLAAAGATWVRIDVGWRSLQPTSRDSYDPWAVGFTDRVIEMATSRGLKPLITLWLTPDWANGGRGDKVLPTDPADYARVAQWAASRWAGKVAAWEVWNEANSEAFLVGTDPVAYTRLLRAAYPAFKAGDPNAKVVFSGTEYNDDRWIARAYAAGAKGAFDVMATHPYQGVHDAAPETPDDGTMWTMRHAAAVRRLMVEQGDGDKPLWFTEFGWTSHGNSNVGLANWDRGVTEQQQGEYFVRTLQLISREMPYVTNVFWFNDRNRSSGNPRLDNYGLLRNDLTPKPALLTLAAHLKAAAAGTTAPAPVPTSAATQADSTTALPTAPPVVAEAVPPPAAPAPAPATATPAPAPATVVGAVPTTSTVAAPLRHRVPTVTRLPRPRSQMRLIRIVSLRTAGFVGPLAASRLVPQGSV